MYLDGTGTPRDYVKAMMWSRRAAEQGIAEAQYNVGSMYLRGWGVPMDEAQARAWYERSASQGFEMAKRRLQDMQLGKRI